MGTALRAIRVVDQLLNEFVESSLSDKSQGSQEAEQFLTQQIAAYGRRLSVTEQQLADFKRTNSGVWCRASGEISSPGCRRRSMRSPDCRRTCTSPIRKRAELAAELKSEQQFTASGAEGPGGGATPLDTEQQIQQDQQRLDEMLLKFTDQYPDVISLRESIKELKAREKEQTAAAKHGDLGAASSLGLSASPVYMKAAGGVQLGAGRNRVAAAADLRPAEAHHSSQVADGLGAAGTGGIRAADCATMT